MTMFSLNESWVLVESLIKLVTALALGGLIGIERQWRQRLAGVRTNALVALGAGAFTVFSLLMPHEVSQTRVAAQVVSGIGFLGAGVIMRDGFQVHGLTTAATLWCAAAVGVLAGAGYIDLALATSLLVLAANLLLRPLSVAISNRAQGKGPGQGWTGRRVRLEWEAHAGQGAQFLDRLEALADRHHAEITRLDRGPGDQGRMDFRWPEGSDATAFAKELVTFEGTEACLWMRRRAMASH